MFSSSEIKTELTAYNDGDKCLMGENGEAHLPMKTFHVIKFGGVSLLFCACATIKSCSHLLEIDGIKRKKQLIELIIYKLT